MGVSALTRSRRKVKKSGLEPHRVEQFIDLLFQYIVIVPAEDFYPAIERADEAIGDTDPTKSSRVFTHWRVVNG